MFSWVLSNKKNRGPMWYIIAMIVIGSLFLFGIVTQLYILSVVVILFAGTFLLIENNSSPITEIEISEKGLKVGENNYLWDDFVTFQMVDAGGSKSEFRLCSIFRSTPRLIQISSKIFCSLFSQNEKMSKFRILTRSFICQKFKIFRGRIFYFLIF